MRENKHFFIMMTVNIKLKKNWYPPNINKVKEASVNTTQVKLNFTASPCHSHFEHNLFISSVSFHLFTLSYCASLIHLFCLINTSLYCLWQIRWCNWLFVSFECLGAFGICSKRFAAIAMHSWTILLSSRKT